MTILNLLLLFLVSLLSKESLADRGCANAYVPWFECPHFSHEGWASWWNSSLTPPPSASNDLLLVLQWPASFCNTVNTNCDPYYRYKPNVFTVHGLWVDGVCCAFNANPYVFPGQIPNNVLNYMRVYWPNLKCGGKPELFWNYEYLKHGSCVKDFMYNQVHYFSTAYLIATRIGDVMKMLLSSGKTLKKGRTYHVNDFSPVTVAGRRILIPRLRCSIGRLGVQLQEIIFCSHRNGKPKNCTGRMGCFVPSYPPQNSFKLP